MVGIIILTISELIGKANNSYVQQYIEWLNNKVNEYGAFNVLAIFVGIFPLIALMFYFVFRNRY